MQLFVVSVLAVLLVLSCPFSMSEVVEKFDGCSDFFSEGQPPVIPGILDPNSDYARYKKICQKYSCFADLGSRYTFATLYDTESRIPVFSAYRYTGRGNFKRPSVPWKIEPQLDPHVAGMTLPYNNQAINEDYLRNSYQVNRGHLFPSCHAADVFIAQSTFTLTNTVPQHKDFNARSWNRMENKAQDIMTTTCINNNDKVEAHVLTGAIPGENKLNGRVNIPSHMWMAFCCYNSRKGQWVSQAYWALNKKESADVEITQKTLQDLQQFLSQNWVKNETNVQLFDKCK